MAAIGRLMRLMALPVTTPLVERKAAFFVALPQGAMGSEARCRACGLSLRVR